MEIRAKDKNKSEEIRCLSFSQERMWFFDQLEPNSFVYNCPLLFRINDGMDSALVEKAFTEILDRHESLRARFKNQNGVPVQIIDNTINFRVSNVDLGSCKGSEQKGEIDRLILKEIQSPFDLSNGPLLRVTLYKLAESKYILLIVLHHITTDAWSQKILIDEFKSLYDSYSNGELPPLPYLPMQYPEFAKWQREKLKGEKYRNHVNYWKDKLSDCPLTLNLPKQLSSESRNHRGAVLSRKLPDDLIGALKNLSQNRGVTLFMVMLAAFYVLLKRYTGQNDIVVGSPIAGRTMLETEKLIGVFINTLVLRVSLTSDPVFTELLEKVRETLLGALAHQDLPFEKLVEELNPERDRNVTPFFQVMFNFKNIPGNQNLNSGIELQELDVHTGSSLFDLDLEVINMGGSFHCLAKYDTDLFESSFIQRLLDSYEVVLKGITQNADPRVSSLPLLTEAELSKQQIEWNDIENKYSLEDVYHELFEEQTKNTPHNIAIQMDNRNISYEEINNQANQVAHYLIERGVDRGSMVGLCFDKSPEMVIGILGIWKVGAIYLPLDPEYPQERLSFMLEDAHVEVLVSKSTLSNHIPASERTTILIDKDWSTIQKHPIANLNRSSSPASLAYVIYTSGSTGKPKGVMIQHGAFANYCQVMKDYWRVNGSGSMLQTASLSFDLSLAEIFVPLVGGMKVVLPVEDFVVPHQLSSILSKYRISRVNFVPAHWRQWIQSLFESEEEIDLSSLEIIGVGSDTLPPDLISKWNELALSKSASVVNAYGPTEVTITTTAHWVPDKVTSTTVPIGRPLPGCTHYVLDENLQLVPIGVSGELHIGGDRLALGYLNRPELTAEKFIPDPFSNQKGARLYKTGDLARYLQDGNIEFLGRIDSQVKIRGFRIEIGEIEYALSSHPAVKEAVVSAFQVRPGEKSLTAYLSSVDGYEISKTQIRQFLSSKLPYYMVPSTILILDAFPLNPNGKIDRNALPNPEEHTAESTKAFIAPENPVQAQLAEIWLEVLNADQVGINDNFFELGGHSLTATQVISRIHATVGIAPLFYINKMV